MTPYDLSDDGPPGVERPSLTGEWDDDDAARYGTPLVMRIYPDRPCLVCALPCRTEGQLCPACAEAGHRVTDTEVIVTLTLEAPSWRTD